MPLLRRHRPYRLLTAGAVLLGALPLAMNASLADPVSLGGAYFGWMLALYLLGAHGTLVAATSFTPGEAMRPGWLLLSASWVVLVPGRLVAGPHTYGLYEQAARATGLLSATSILSGALGVAGFLSLAGAWRATGLDASTRASRVVLRLGALAVALALAGPELVARFPAALAGDPMALADVVSDLLDGALLVVAVPVLRAALSLGGGLVVWPWGLLTLSLLAWLGFDAAVTWGHAIGLSPRSARVAVEAMRSLAAAAAFAAGLAQRWVMQGAPGSAAAPPSPAS